RELKLPITLGELAIDPDRGLVQRRKLRIERMLNGPHVAPRCSCADLRALEERHPRAGLGRKRRRRTADDPAADDRDLHRSLLAHGLRIGPTLAARLPSPGHEGDLRS